MSATQELTEPAPATVVIKPSVRILYLDGPGNVLNTFRFWQQQQHDSNEVSLTFSGDFFDFATDVNAQAIVIATHPEAGSVQSGRFRVQHVPVPTRASGGLAYHLGEIKFSLWLAWTALRNHSDILILADRVHWFALWPARLLGKKVVPMLHCAFWPHGFRRTSTLGSLVERANAVFWRKAVSVTLCISPEAEEQLLELAGSIPTPVLQVRSQYHRAFFSSISPPPALGPVLHVFFAGRIEVGKGVFDLLEIATRLQTERPGEYFFELAGEGSAAAKLAQAIQANGLESTFHLLGKLDQAGMAQAYGRAHVVIVPTNADFAEGMNRVTIEGVLAGRPVITSPASHVTGVLGPAVLEVPVGDIGGYTSTLLSLKEDASKYAQLCAATQQFTEPFYDRSQGYRARLKDALSIAIPGLPPHRTRFTPLEPKPQV